MTPPEVRLWAVLRQRPDGIRFRRQHPVGRYVLDFYCPAARIAVEIDGGAHDLGDRPARDAARDGWMAEQGIAVLRLTARDVMADFEAAVRLVLHRCFPLHQPAAGPPPHALHGEDEVLSRSA